jgi:3-oxoacyl-[acyl-carrier protein] reductase
MTQTRETPAAPGPGGRLQGKVAIVTGAAVGIGRAIAVAYGRQGARVVVNYSRSAAEAEETVAQVRGAGAEALAVRADVSDDAAVRAMVGQTVERFGAVDVLVNNAGITAHVPFEDLEALTDEIWDRLYAVNVKGAFYCARAVTPQMRRQGLGRIINLGSVAGQRAFGSSIAYSASKAALIHLGRCLAKTLAPQIRVNVIVPGSIAETRWNAGRPGFDPEAARRAGAASAPLLRAGTPEDIAETALYLAAGADFLTGAVLNVDGGREIM